MTDVKPFWQMSNHDENTLVFRCPLCLKDTYKRADSFLPGVHVITCQNFDYVDPKLSCGYSTSAILLETGERREVTAEAHKGGGV